MNEIPFFAPFGEEHLAAVLSLPEGPPRGLVLLLQGGDAPRGHNNQKWTRLARALAERGVASVRMDYLGMGDSTGEYRLEVAAPPAEEAEAVLAPALDALGLREYAVTGNCIGLRTAFTLASRREGCVAIAAIFSRTMGPILAERHAQPSARRLQSSRPQQKGLRRLAAGALRRLRRRRTPRVPPLMPEFSSVLSSTNVLLLHAATEQWEQRIRATAQTVARSHPSGSALEIRVQRLPSRELEKQEAIVQTVSHWMDRVLPGPAGRSASTPEGALQEAGR